MYENPSCSTYSWKSDSLSLFFNIFHPGGCIVDSIVVVFFFFLVGFTDEVKWNWESFDTMKKKEFKHFGRWEGWFINPPSRFISYLPPIPSPGGPRWHSLHQGIEKYTYQRVMASLESAVASGSAGLWCSRETIFGPKNMGSSLIFWYVKPKVLINWWAEGSLRQDAELWPLTQFPGLG